MRRSFFLPLAWLFVTGCATAPAPPVSRFTKPPGMFPSSGLITQRAVLTARGRQFTLNGYLALAGNGDRRLVVLETFGHVMADVLVKADGHVYVMQFSRMFPPEWIRRYMVADVECIFGEPAADCPVTMPEPAHFVLKRRGYSLDVRIVETKAGPQPAEMFDETRARHANDNA